MFALLGLEVFQFDRIHLTDFLKGGFCDPDSPGSPTSHGLSVTAGAVRVVVLRTITALGANAFGHG